MKIIYGVVVQDGKIIRKPIILNDRKCDECDKKFTPKRQDSKYCSRQCSKLAEGKRNAERYKANSKRYYREHLETIKKCRKEYYWSDPERWREKAKQYRINHKEEKSVKDSIYKDKIRHGGKRAELLEQNGCVCSKCGKETNSFNITAHHKTFNSSEHEHQELLCRSCHFKIHHLS